MPKISDIIVGRARISGFDATRLSKKTGIARSTLYRKLKNPGDLRLYELYLIDKAIKFSDEELLYIIRRR